MEPSSSQPPHLTEQTFPLDLSAFYDTSLTSFPGSAPHASGAHDAQPADSMPLAAPEWWNTQDWEGQIAAMSAEMGVETRGGGIFGVCSGDGMAEDVSSQTSTNVSPSTTYLDHHMLTFLQPTPVYITAQRAHTLMDVGNDMSVHQSQARAESQTTGRFGITPEQVLAMIDARVKQVLAQSRIKELEEKVVSIEMVNNLLKGQVAALMGQRESEVGPKRGKRAGKGKGDKATEEARAPRATEIEVRTILLRHLDSSTDNAVSQCRDLFESRCCRPSASSTMDVSLNSYFLHLPILRVWRQTARIGGTPTGLQVFGAQRSRSSSSM